MKILITGGLGHIGSKLIRSIPTYHDVVVIDNLSTQRYCSLFNLNRPIKFIESDIEDISTDILYETDIVIHLAAITNASKSFGNKSEIESVNVTKTKKLIDKCKHANIKCFVFPSSTSVYGVSREVVHEDDDTALNPQSPYAESKLKVERMLKSQSDFNYIIFRFGTIFGTSIGMRFHTAINKFCYEASIGVPLTIWKQNYNQVRPYLGLNDAIDAISYCIFDDADKTQRYFNQVYNVISGNYKLNNIIEYIKSEIPDVKLNMIDTPLLNQYTYNVSDNKIRSYGFYATDNIKQQIRFTLKYLKNINDKII